MAEHPCKQPVNPFMKDRKMIEPLRLEGNENVRDFINNVFGGSGYNSRRLAEACNIFSRMLRDDTTVCLTLAGAMTPIGMSGPIISLMEKGFVDFIISTGANLYHDLHRAFDFPMVQGETNVNDLELYKHGIARIYDVFIEDSETMLNTDKAIVRIGEDSQPNKPISSAVLHRLIGEQVLKNSPHPEKSILANAAKYNVPVYTSSPGDSSLAMNLALPYIFDHKIIIDPVLDVVETTALIRNANKNGVIIVGGGSPKNFYMQTQPTLWQIFQDSKKGGHDYFIQLTTDSPQWGGLSGATPQEAESWGKVKNAEKNSAVVYSCASITFPLLCQYALINEKPKQLKELYKKRENIVNEFIEIERKNKKLIDYIRKNIRPDMYERIYKKHIKQN